MVYNIWYEPCREKTCFWDFQPGQTQIVLNNHKRWLGLKFCMFEVKGLYYLYEYVAQTKALINCTVQLICKFVFAYAKSRFLMMLLIYKPPPPLVTFIHVSISDQSVNLLYDMSRLVRKPAFYICKNKDADQLRGNREADHRLCFRYTDRTIPLLAKYKISCL